MKGESRLPPLSMMIKPSSGKCNMRCSYCFYADETEKRQTADYGFMTEQTLENLIRRAFSYADGPVAFAFQGGEPTLRGADFYRHFLALEKKYNAARLPVSHALQTNALTLTDEMLSVLKDGHFLVGVSLDGTAAIHDARRVDKAGNGTYDRIRSNLNRLKETGIDFNILCVVDNTVAAHPKEVFEALEEYTYFQFIPCLAGLEQDADTQLDPTLYGQFLCAVYTLYRQRLKSGHPVSVRDMDNRLSMLMGRPPEQCGMSGVCGINYLIEADGSVFPCDFYALDEWKLGNINQCSFYTLARSDKQKQFLSSSVPLCRECRECEYLDFCRGGCRRERENTGKNRLCAGMKLFCEKELADMRLLAAELSNNIQRRR